MPTYTFAENIYEREPRSLSCELNTSAQLTSLKCKMKVGFALYFYNSHHDIKKIEELSVQINDYYVDKSKCF